MASKLYLVSFFWALTLVVGCKTTPSASPQLQSGDEVDKIPPSVPRALKFSGVTSSVATLTWSASTDNVAVTGYHLDLATDAAFTQIVAGYQNKNVGNVTSLDLSNLLSGQIYYARATAQDAAGNLSAMTAPVSAMTIDIVAPAVTISNPLNLANVSGILQVKGTTTDNVGVTALSFSVDGVASGTANGNSPFTFSLNTAALSIGAHTLLVKASDAAGNSATATAKINVLDVAAPTIPLNANLVSASELALTLNWSASTDNVAVTGYLVDISTTPDFSKPLTGYSARSVGNATSVVVSGLTYGITYYARVRAFDGANNVSANSNSATRATPTLNTCAITNNSTANQQIQNCINSTPSGGVAEIPGNIYVITNQLQITKPMTLRTAGTGPLTNVNQLACFYTLADTIPAGSNIGSRNPNVPCALFLADPSLAAYGGLLYIGPPISGTPEPTASLANATVDHIAVSGNMTSLWTSRARQLFQENNLALWGLTVGNPVVFKNCTNCQFSYGAAIQAIGNSCLSWYGSTGGRILNNLFSGCGQRNPLPPPVTSSSAQYPPIANGIDFKSTADNDSVMGNSFIENTDVALGFDVSSALNLKVQNNYFLMQTQGAHAQIMFDGQPQRFDVGQAGYDGTIAPPVTPGALKLAPSDYGGSDVSGNKIFCNGRSDFGILAGSHPWDPSLPTAIGLNIHDNSIDGCRRGLELDDAGTATNPVVLNRNAITNTVAMTMPFNAVFGSNGDLTGAANQFVPFGCWQQDFALATYSSHQILMNPCGLVIPTSAVDISPTSFWTSQSDPQLAHTSLGWTSNQFCTASIDTAPYCTNYYSAP